MLADALGTYAAALILIVVSTAIGSGILAAAGARKWSPTSAVIGLAAASVIAWWSVRLPGHGLTALLALIVVAAIAGVVAAVRLEGMKEGFSRCWPTALVALAVVSIPFAANGHFGVLGTGFNVDMSQHLFAANWLADPTGLSPSLIRNGYPLGPHALAVAANEVTGELTIAFTGITIAVPVLLAVAVMAALDPLSRVRAVAIGVLTAVAYLAASYLAQGAFKELFEAAFLLGFALWLRDLTGQHDPDGPWGRGLFVLLPGAVIAAGALYVYSWPGLAWLAGTLGLWTLVELYLRRADLSGTIRRVMPCALVGLVAVAVLAAPEVDRISKFGTSVDAVTERTPKPPGTGAHQDGSGSGYGSPQAAGIQRERPDYDNSLGNLFGQINPGSVFGIWPSGDFRVNPGDGAVPAVVFYLGALLGAAALALGAIAAFRQAETALLAALAAAAAIWLAARAGSTAYTAAKALQMIAPVAMLIAARGLLDPVSPVPLRERSRRGFTVLVAAFAAGAAISSGLALGNAPVGPDDYTPGVRNLANRFAGQSTLLLAPPDIVADQHGAEFYGWELRGAGETEVAALEQVSDGSAAPPGVTRVLVVGGSQAPPFADLKRIGSSNRVVLWRVLDAGQ